jgi:hypothetical protein
LRDDLFPSLEQAGAPMEMSLVLRDDLFSLFLEQGFGWGTSPGPAGCKAIC